MKPCLQCHQQNPDEAKFCYECGVDLTVPADSSPTREATIPVKQNEDIWRTFIGPNADRYMEHFKKFGTEQSPKFALTWNWPAFLFIPFLWFLYRKMYLYAAVYAIGPMISTILTSDMSSGLVWSVVAGATANYVYYWHCREQIGAITRQNWNDEAKQEAAIQEAGGVQPYVIYVGIALYVLFSMTMFKMIQERGFEEELSPATPAKPTAIINT